MTGTSFHREMAGPGLNSQLDSLKGLGRHHPTSSMAFADQLTSGGKRTGDYIVMHLRCMVVLVLFPQPSNQSVQTCWDQNSVDMKGGFISHLETTCLALLCKFLRNRGSIMLAVPHSVES